MTRSICAAVAAIFLLSCTGQSEARRHTGAVEVPGVDRHSTYPGYYPVSGPNRIAKSRHSGRHASKSSKRVKVAHRGRNAARGHPRGEASNALVATAQSYIGTNPTGWARVWCGRFMAMIAPEAAKRVPNPNLARAWLVLPRVARQVGAIVVLSRGGRGGHIGVVAGFGVRGPIVISGNHGRRVGVGEYPERRVLAYVSPNG